MVRNVPLQDVIQSIAGETWAIAYAYESPRSPRNLWYDRWRYDVINDYVEAVSILGVEPFIIDVDSLIDSGKLKKEKIDFLINLNSGATPISNLGLVPSLAEWNHVPCFPNSADVILAGERKDICKRIFSRWFNVPRDLTREEAESGLHSFIRKPKTMGNSQGVSRQIDLKLNDNDAIIEEFVPGYEITVPVFFDVETGKYCASSPIVYFPDVEKPSEWFLSYEEKMDNSVVIDRKIYNLTRKFSDALVEASQFFQFQTIARFDFRWKTSDPNSNVIDLNDVWFLEINCLPTLRANVNFLLSLTDYLSRHPHTAVASFSSDAHEDVRTLAFLLAHARGRFMTI